MLGAPPPDKVRAEDDVRDKTVAGMPSMTMRLPAGTQDIRPPAAGAAPRAACHSATGELLVREGRGLSLNLSLPGRGVRILCGRYGTQQSREKKMIFYSGPISLCRVMWLG